MKHSLGVLYKDGITHLELRGFMNFITNSTNYAATYTSQQIAEIWLQILDGKPLSNLPLAPHRSSRHLSFRLPTWSLTHTEKPGLFLVSETNEILEFNRETGGPNITLRFIVSVGRTITPQEMDIRLMGAVTLQADPVVGPYVVGFDIVDEEDRYSLPHPKP